jgi:hypothetical protein
MFGKAKKSVVLSKCEWYEQSSQKLYRDHVLVRRMHPPHDTRTRTRHTPFIVFTLRVRSLHSSR